MAEGLNSRSRYGRSALGEVSSASIVSADSLITGVSGGTVEAQIARLQLNKIGGDSFDSKGDLLAGTGPDAFAVRTVGADGAVLTADSAEVTGVKWAAPGASSAPSISRHFLFMGA